MQIHNSKSIKQYFKDIVSKLWTINYGLKTTRGFTLIETLVAITLLVIAITGPLQIASNALNSAFYARDEITAYYLAVEAIEYIKNSRDSAFLYDVFEGDGSSSYWLRGLTPCIGDASDPDFAGCYVKTTLDFNTDPSLAVLSCDTDSGCPVLKYNDSQTDAKAGFWGYSSDEIGPSVDTKFKRKIVITPDSAGDNEAVIKVTITWPSQSLAGADKTYELTDIMTNWERK